MLTDLKLNGKCGFICIVYRYIYRYVHAFIDVYIYFYMFIDVFAIPKQSLVNCMNMNMPEYVV